MQIVFIFHGAYGDGTENWIPWIQGELEKRGCEVMVPLFPTPEGQSFDSWMKVFEEYKPRLSADSIL